MIKSVLLLSSLSIAVPASFFPYEDAVTAACAGALSASKSSQTSFSAGSTASGSDHDASSAGVYSVLRPPDHSETNLGPTALDERNGGSSTPVATVASESMSEVGEQIPDSDIDSLSQSRLLTSRSRSLTSRLHGSCWPGTLLCFAVSAGVASGPLFRAFSQSRDPHDHISKPDTTTATVTSAEAGPRSGVTQWVQHLRGSEPLLRSTAGVDVFRSFDVASAASQVKVDHDSFWDENILRSLHEDACFDSYGAENELSQAELWGLFPQAEPIGGICSHTTSPLPDTPLATALSKSTVADARFLEKLEHSCTDASLCETLYRALHYFPVTRLWFGFPGASFRVLAKALPAANNNHGTLAQREAAPSLWDLIFATSLRDTLRHLQVGQTLDEALSAACHSGSEEVRRLAAHYTEPFIRHASEEIRRELIQKTSPSRQRSFLSSEDIATVANAGKPPMRQSHGRALSFPTRRASIDGFPIEIDSVRFNTPKDLLSASFLSEEDILLIATAKGNVATNSNSESASPRVNFSTLHETVGEALYARMKLHLSLLLDVVRMEDGHEEDVALVTYVSNDVSSSAVVQAFFPLLFKERRGHAVDLIEVLETWAAALAVRKDNCRCKRTLKNAIEKMQVLERFI